LPHAWIELEEPEAAKALLERFGAKPSETPVTVWQGKDLLKNPMNAEFARTTGLAAVYGASEGLSTLALESTALGGQAGTFSRIENYLGFPVGLWGFELASRAMVQADKFGARTAVPREAVRLRRGEDGLYRIELSEGGEVTARSVIIATGAHYRRLNVPQLERFEGVSVHYAATESEAQRCEGEEVVIVGGGNSAGQAALFLAERTRRVYLIIRGGDLGKSMSSYLVNRIKHVQNVELLADTKVRELVGKDRLDGVVVGDKRSGSRRTLGARALFVFIGAQANTGWLEAAVELDARGFVLTGRELYGHALEEYSRQEYPRDPFLLETSLPGVFAAGDVRSGSIKRCASAVGDGAMALRFVHQYLADAGV
jgi:thioredoxin reductase (NADPH)